MIEYNPSERQVYNSHIFYYSSERDVIIITKHKKFLEKKRNFWKYKYPKISNLGTTKDFQNEKSY